MRVYLIRLAFMIKQVVDRLLRPVRMGVRMILLDGDEVLLLRHTYMPGWHFPGGTVNPHESLLEAAAREAKEEAGVELLEPPTLVDILTSHYWGISDHTAVYVCYNFREQKATDRWEIAEVKRFPVAALPPQMGSTIQKVVNALYEKRIASSTG